MLIQKNPAAKCLLTIFLTCTINTALGAQCPKSPTEYAVDIPDPRPEAQAGEFPQDMQALLKYAQEHNINSVKTLLDHTPRHLRSYYSLVSETGALNKTSLQKPGLVMFGADARFMMNIGSDESADLYEVVDIAQLTDQGDWEFRTLDFRSGAPELSQNGGNDGECRECHGEKSMRPIWGKYLEWPGIIGDGKPGGHEEVLPHEVPTLKKLKNGTLNPQRFHHLDVHPEIDQAHRSIYIPGHRYGHSLTISNNEIGGATAESIYQRARRSPLYAGLREELLTLSFCYADRHSGDHRLSEDKLRQVKALFQSMGQVVESPGWEDVYRLWGLDAIHEIAIHKKASERAETNSADWNASSGDLREFVDMLVLVELANESPQVNAILKRNPPQFFEYLACPNRFSTIRDHLDHLIHANFTLKGNARQLARTMYYDGDASRVHRSITKAKGELCQLLTSDISQNTLGDREAPASSCAIANCLDSGQQPTGAKDKATQASTKEVSNKLPQKQATSPKNNTASAQTNDQKQSSNQQPRPNPGPARKTAPPKKQGTEEDITKSRVTSTEPASRVVTPETVKPETVKNKAQTVSIQQAEFTFPAGLENYQAKTRVYHPGTGKIYQCKPFPYSGFCRQWAKQNTQFEPGTGSHWEMAWEQL